MSDKSIEGLRIYSSSRKVEDCVYELVKALPEKEFYKLGNDLRRSSAAVSHHIAEAHKRYSYTVKLECLHLARIESEELRALLATYSDKKYGDTTSLQEDALGITKQAYGLIRYFKQKQAERQATAEVNAADELVAARS